MTIDAEGMLWVAMYDGWKVSQVHLVFKGAMAKYNVLARDEATRKANSPEGNTHTDHALTLYI